MKTEVDDFDKNFQSNLRMNAKHFCTGQIQKLERRSKVARFWAWLFVALGFAVVYFGWLSLFRRNDWYEIEHLGTYGGFLQGSVSSLWSLSALLFVYAAFLGQQMDFFQQGAELQDQKAQFALQQDSVKRQNFENSFFQLLNFQNGIAEQLRLKKQGLRPHDAEIITGRACFLSFVSMLQARFHEQKPSLEQKQDVNFAIQCYGELLKRYQPVLGHYFRTLYHVFSFISTSEFPKVEKRRYSSLVRAQLSTGELLLLFYNCLTAHGGKFKPLVTEFGLLEHIDKDSLLDPSHIGFYPQGAYE